MSNNIYNQFNETLKYNLSNILKSTKDMIIDTKKFKGYSQNYYNFTQSTTFMKPEINEYPIIKNTKYIPINKKIFSLSNEGEKKLKKKKIFKRNLLLNDSKKSILPTTHRTINSGYSTVRNLSSSIGRKKVEQDKLFILRNNIFYDELYSNLEYDESEIFHKGVYYNKFIQNYIENLKKNKTENLTTFVKRNFYDMNDFDLIEDENTCVSSIMFKSMKIEFINQTDPSKEIISYEIPFTYLPVFYYNNMKNLKYVLLSVFKFSKDFEKINFENDEMYNLIKNAQQYEFYKRKKTQNNEEDEEEMINFNNVSIGNMKKLIFRNKKTKIKISDNNYLKTTNILNVTKFENQFTFYNYIWVTPKYTYKVVVKTPEINVRINKLDISKYIDIELFYFLLQRDFLNWDFFIVHYLFSFKSFRWIIKNYLSKNKSKNLQLKYNPEKHGYIRFERIGFNLNIFLTNEKSLSITKINHHYMLFYTNEELKNYLKILHSYSAIVSNDAINTKNEFYFSFNFSQMIILNKISKIQDLSDFINKLLYTQNSYIFLQFNFFVHFDNKIYIEKSKVSEKKRKSSENGRKSSSLLSRHSLSPEPIIPKHKIIDNSKFIIKVTNPHIETVEYLNNKILQEGNCIISNETQNNYREINEKGLDEICNNKMEDWPKYILKHSKNDKSYLDKCRVLKSKLVKTTTVKNINNRKTTNLLNSFGIKSKKTLSYFSPQKNMS